MNKALVTIVWVMLLGTMVYGQEEKADHKTNAYRIEFLDSQAKPLAAATFIGKEFIKEDKPPKQTKCQMVLLENSNTGPEVKSFKNMIPEGGEREITIETKKEPQLGSGGHVLIEFNPGTSDANIHVILNLDKNPPEGTWLYSTFIGGSTGGKVQVSRVQAEQKPAGEGSKRQAGKEVIPPPSDLPPLIDLPEP